MAMQLAVVLLITLFTTGESRPVVEIVESKPVMVMMVDCEALGGTVPVPIYNSQYRILPNGTLCCPLDYYLPNNEPYCISKAHAREECEKQGRGLRPEPCAHCWTCAKLLGESCEGPQLSHGLCDAGLKCIGVEQDQNGTGACTTENGPRISAIGERCGGRFESLGVCAQGLKCTEEEESVEGGICIMEAKTQGFTELCGGIYGYLGRCLDGLRCTVPEESFLSESTRNNTGNCYREKDNFCFKNCASPGRKIDYVCGSDRVWYPKICYLKQQNCPLHKDDPNKIVKKDDEFCGPRPTMMSTVSPTAVPTSPATAPENIVEELEVVDQESDQD